MFSTPIPDDILFQRVVKSEKKVIVAINKIDLVDKVNVNSNQQETVHRRHGDNGDQFTGEEKELVSYKRTVTIEEAVKNWRGLIPNALAILPLTASNGGDDVGVMALRSLLLGGPDVPASVRDMGRPIPGMFPPNVKFISNQEALEIIPSGPPLYDENTLTDRTER